MNKIIDLNRYRKKLPNGPLKRPSPNETDESSSQPIEYSYFKNDEGIYRVLGLIGLGLPLYMEVARHFAPLSDLGMFISIPLILILVPSALVSAIWVVSILIELSQWLMNPRYLTPLCIIGVHKWGEIFKPRSSTMRLSIGGFTEYQCQYCPKKMVHKWSAF
jgi:hypothetical protein